MKLFSLVRAEHACLAVAMLISACSVAPTDVIAPPGAPTVSGEKPAQNAPAVPSAQMPVEKSTAQIVGTSDEVVVAGILGEVSRAMSVGGDTLKREIASASAAWGVARTDATRLKLALLLAMISSGLADDQRALSLLEPWSGKSVGPSAFKSAADIVVILVSERARLLREEVKRTDAQRERAETAKKELDATTQKLNALRQLERNLGRRKPQ